MLGNEAPRFLGKMVWYRSCNFSACEVNVSRLVNYEKSCISLLASYILFSTHTAKTKKRSLLGTAYPFEREIYSAQTSTKMTGKAFENLKEEEEECINDTKACTCNWDKPNTGQYYSPRWLPRKGGQAKVIALERSFDGIEWNVSGRCLKLYRYEKVVF